MTTPNIRILGVYKPEIPEDVYQEQWRGTGSDERTRAHFEKLVLIEAVLTDIDGGFKAVKCGQSCNIAGFKPHFQCAYDEALLSADGTYLIDRRMNCVHGTGELRLTFYLHFYDPEQPLQWSHGQVQCPPIQPVPDRRRNLVPYRACT
jgi:hypothetical protein